MDWRHVAGLLGQTGCAVKVVILGAGGGGSFAPLEDIRQYVEMLLSQLCAGVLSGI